MTTIIDGVNTPQIRNAKNGDFDLNLGGSGGGGNVYPQLTIKSRSQGNVEFEFVDGSIPITSVINDKRLIEIQRGGYYSTLYVKDVKLLLNDLLYDEDTDSYVESGFYSAPILIDILNYDVSLQVPEVFVIGKQYIYRMSFDENMSLNEINYYTGRFSIRMQSALNVSSKYFSILSPAVWKSNQQPYTRVRADLITYDGSADTRNFNMMVCAPDIKIASDTNFTFFASGQLIYYNAGTSSYSLANNQIVAYIEHSANGES